MSCRCVHLPCTAPQATPSHRWFSYNRKWKWIKTRCVFFFFIYFDFCLVIKALHNYHGRSINKWCFIITKCSLMNLTNTVLKNLLVFSPCSCSMSLRTIKKQKGAFFSIIIHRQGECTSQALFSGSCPTKAITGIDVWKKNPRDTNLYYYSVQFSEKMRKPKCATEWCRKPNSSF